MKAYDIKWAVTDYEIFCKLSEMDDEVAAEKLEMYPYTYSHMSDEERESMVYSYLRHQHNSCRAGLIDLPSEVELEEGIFGNLHKEDIIDWLQQQYGYYVEDCKIER
jgi:hypothetical protein